MIKLEKLVSGKCDPYTLMGTSVCEQGTCQTCISNLKCCIKGLCIEVANVSVEMKKPIKVLFPSLTFLVDLIFEEEKLK